MKRVRDLVSKYFGTVSGELSVGAVSVRALAEEYGTPLFAYDGRVLDRKWDRLRSAYPADFAIHYSVKANPNPAILKHFLQKGSGLEVASGGELDQAMRAGCSPGQILFAGPGKTAAELEMALAYDVGEIHVESLLEIERLNTIAERLGKHARVAVRVNPGREAQGGAMRMGGKPAPFGVDEECLDSTLERLLSCTFLEFQGVHLFIGTQVLDYATLLQQYRAGIEIAKRAATGVSRPLSTVDFGGGLGVPYFAHESELDMEGLRQGLKNLVAEIRKEPLLRESRLVVEPGRYLVAESGVYITRVNDKKVSRSKNFLVVDGGLNHHLAASGNLGQTIKRNFPVAILNRLDEEPTETVDVVGPLCTPLDVLAREVSLPAARVGDLVGVFQSGAYARTASPLGFLSHATPPEVLVEDGRAILIRRRGSYEDFYRDLVHV